MLYGVLLSACGGSLFSLSISCVMADNIRCASLVQGQRLPETFKFDALITTYEIIIADVELLTSIEWRCCIIDEAHRLKNKNCRLLEGLRLFDIVSGTPYQSFLYTYTVLKLFHWTAIACDVGVCEWDTLPVTSVYLHCCFLYQLVLISMG